MPFGALSPGERLRILLELRGAAEYAAGMRSSAEATLMYERAQKKASIAEKEFNQRTFIQNQLLFTARRLLFYTTLGVIALGGEAVKMGFQYTNALQSARVALHPLYKDQGALNKQLQDLFRIAAFTPFQFKDITTAFRVMYGAMRPLGISAHTVQTTIQGIANALAFAGKSTPQQLNRVSTALQHMAFQGRLTGQVVLQLARDGIPIYAILHKQLGLTATEMQRIGNLGVSPLRVLKAINSFLLTAPGYRLAAFKQATSTLGGLWTTFKDILSQAMGGSTRGLFTGIQGHLRRALLPFQDTRKPITLTALAESFDKSLTPKTHALIYTFQTLEGVLEGIKATFKVILFPVVLLNKAFATLGFMTKINEWFFRRLGKILGVLVTIWAIQKSLILANAVRLELLQAAAWSFGLAENFAAWSSQQLSDRLIFQMLITQRLVIATVIAALKTKALAVANAILGATLGVTTAEVWALTVALLANPITWIVVAVLALAGGLVILYFRWKAFRDVVNATAEWIWKNWKYMQLLAIAFGPVAIAMAGIVTVVRYWHDLYGILSSVLGLLPRLWHGLGHAAHSVFHAVTHPWSILPFASGGTMPRSGLALVGEAGPEILRLPAGSQITPVRNTVSSGGSASPLQQIAELISIVIYPQDINISGKKVAQAISTAKTDVQARS